MKKGRRVKTLLILIGTLSLIIGSATLLLVKNSIDITKGFLDIDMDAKAVSNKIDAPGKAVLRNLEFKSGSSMGNTVFDVPLSTIGSFLKNNRDGSNIKKLFTK